MRGVVRVEYERARERAIRERKGRNKREGVEREVERGVERT